MKFKILSCFVAAAGIGLVTGCASEQVSLAVYNASSQPLRCTILFGHWIEQGAGAVLPEQGLRVALRRQNEDGALYIRRDDGRKMMIENFVCGPVEDWWERRADIPLLPLRTSGEQDFVAFCRMEDRAECTGPFAASPGYW